MPLTVLLLCGLPASGKSTLATRIKEHYAKDAKIKDVIHLEYDAYEDVIVSQQGGDDDERREAWNQARQAALRELEAALKEDRKREDDTSKLILMDDNFHLRGMRKQIHRLLLQYKPIQFGLLWLETPMAVCLQRNQNRKRHIPDHVIQKINGTIEPPRAAWEACWISVSETTSFAAVIDFVEGCSELVDLLPPVDVEQQEQDRKITLASQRHTWDKLSRSWVALVAKFDKSLARHANTARKDLLLQLKSGECSIRDESQFLELFVDLVVRTRSETAPDGNLRVKLMNHLLK